MKKTYIKRYHIHSKLPHEPPAIPRGPHSSFYTGNILIYWITLSSGFLQNFKDYIPWLFPDFSLTTIDIFPDQIKSAFPNKFSRRSCNMSGDRSFEPASRENYMYIYIFPWLHVYFPDFSLTSLSSFHFPDFSLTSLTSLTCRNPVRGCHEKHSV